MNNMKLTPELSRAARQSLRLSQRDAAEKSGVNRSQLALFEVGKYNLEVSQLRALVECYERLGYKFPDIPPASIVSSNIRENVLKPSLSRNQKGIAANNAEKFPRVIDGIIISDSLSNSDADRIAEEINRNNLIIRRLGNTVVDLAMFTNEPRTNEHEIIIRLSARNYQLSLILQGRKLFPGNSINGGKKLSHRQMTAAELTLETLNSGIELPEIS